MCHVTPPHDHHSPYMPQSLIKVSSMRLCLLLLCKLVCLPLGTSELVRLKIDTDSPLHNCHWQKYAFKTIFNVHSSPEPGVLVS